MGKREPKPQGEVALTLAERQARYWVARQAGTSAVRYCKSGDRRSRPQRWKDAVAELIELQAGYQYWLDSLPESLRDAAAALAAVCALDLSELGAWSRRAGSGATSERGHPTLPVPRCPMLHRSNAESPLWKEWRSCAEVAGQLPGAAVGGAAPRLGGEQYSKLAGGARAGARTCQDRCTNQWSRQHKGPLREGRPTNGGD